jgi:competence protein ComFC
LTTPVLPAPTSISASERALRVLFPPRCAGCGLWCDELFCDFCRAQLRAIEAPLCALCGQPFDALAQVLETSLCADCRANRYHAAPCLGAMRAPLEYSGAIREAIHNFKYKGRTSRAQELSALLHHYLMSTLEGRALPVENFRLIIPVPLHSWRQWRRGNNQSTLLARALAQQLAKQHQTPVVVAEVLRRVRHTVPQIELHQRERAANIKDAFALDQTAWSQYSGASESSAVLLLDDVTTTGATLFECARVLTQSTELKAEQIFALTLARAL